MCKWRETLDFLYPLIEIKTAYFMETEKYWGMSIDFFYGDRLISLMLSAFVISFWRHSDLKQAWKRHTAFTIWGMLCWIETGHQTVWTDMDTVVWMKCNNASLNKPPLHLLTIVPQIWIHFSYVTFLTMALCVRTALEILCAQPWTNPLLWLCLEALLALVFLSLKPTFKTYNPALLGYLPWIMPLSADFCGDRTVGQERDPVIRWK